MSKTREQRLRRVLETMTRQHDRLRDPPAYGSWLLGWVSERPLRRRVRIQIILTIALITANLVGIGLAVLLENVAFPTPSIVSDAPLWITFVAGPAYTVIGMALGSYYVKVQTLAALRWASEEHTPSRADQRNTLLAPLRVAVGTLILWAVGAALFTTLYGLANRLFIPQVMFSTLFLRRSGRHRLLHAHRVRSAPGGRPGTRGRATAGTVRTGNHRPDHGGVAAQLGRAALRYRLARDP